LEHALQIGTSTGDDEIFIVGGAELYREALALADRLNLTRIHATVEGDAYFPDVRWDKWRLVESGSHDADNRNDFPFTFEVYERSGGA
jgi:dihydrofolate reductase